MVAAFAILIEIEKTRGEKEGFILEKYSTKKLKIE